MPGTNAIEEILQKIVNLKPEERRELFQRLPRALSLASKDSEDGGWLTLAESTFDFWDNDEDARYDQL